MVSFRTSLMATSVVAASAACTLLNPLDLYTGGDASSRDTTTPLAPLVPDGASLEDAGVASCTLRKAPERLVGGPAGGDLTIVNALDSFEFNDPSDPKKANRTGLDIDGVCTCPGARACRPVQGAGICDFPEGVDNAGGDFFLSLYSVLNRDSNPTSRLRDGRYGVLIRVRNYNGLPDDDDVEVALFNTFGLDIPPDGGLPDGALPVPKRDGTDKWTVDAKSLLGGMPYLPNIVDTRGFVRNGVVVSKLSNSIRIGPYILPIVGGTLTARLKKVGSSFGLEEGVVSGRTNARELLTALEGVPNPLDPSTFLCGDTNPVFTSLRDNFCKTLDVPTDVTLDGKEAPCDAASISVRFTSSPALLGRVVDNGSPRKPCGESWVASCPRN